MKHVIFGGDGFVGRQTVELLLKAGQDVLVCDITKSDLPMYERARHLRVDIRAPEEVEKVPIAADDIVYNVAATMLHPMVKRAQRYEHFFSVDYHGAVHVIEHMERAGCHRLIQFSTDMVYGRLQTVPPIEVDHPRVPIGEYSDSKRAIEDYCLDKRKSGLNVSIFRPRIIVGPGRVGILGRLFILMKLGLPVPMIGSGNNRYQMISVYDCASAAVASADRGVVNGEFNLGSDDPPTVKELLRALIREAGSRSFVVPTPAELLKVVLRLLDQINFPLLVPEQFEIADADYVVSTRTTRDLLGWTPQHGDLDMMIEAYRQWLALRPGAPPPPGTR